MPIRFQARLPSAGVPERLYYCAAAGSALPSTVNVTTDDTTGRRVCPVPSGETPDGVNAKAYAQAVDLGLRGIPTIRIIKEDGVHQQVVYTTPVRARNRRDPIGVLIGVDVPSPDPASPTPTPSPEDVERAMLAEMIRANPVAAE